MTTTGTILDLTQPGARVCFELPDSRGSIAATVVMVNRTTATLYDGATRERLGWLVELELVVLDLSEATAAVIPSLGRLALGAGLRTSLGAAAIHELHAGLSWERQRRLDLPPLDYAAVADLTRPIAAAVPDPRPIWREHRSGSIQLGLLYPQPPHPQP